MKHYTCDVKGCSNLKANTDVCDITVKLWPISVEGKSYAGCHFRLLPDLCEMHIKFLTETLTSFMGEDNWNKFIES